MTELSDIHRRAVAAQSIARKAGDLALGYFRKLETLTIERKGHQDLVSEADKAVEALIRKEVQAQFPDDAMLGEEDGMSLGSSGFTWVCDPIDGTANFVTGIPAWCVSIAVTTPETIIIGVIHDPCADDMVSAIRGEGTKRNGKLLPKLPQGVITAGSVGVGLSNRIEASRAIQIIERLMATGGMFFRNASGALMLSYVATGRLLGYIEPHMNAWDCLAGFLLVEEAGGLVLPYDIPDMLENGGYVLAAAPGIYEACREIAAV